MRAAWNEDPTEELRMTRRADIRVISRSTIKHRFYTTVEIDLEFNGDNSNIFESHFRGQAYAAQLVPLHGRQDRLERSSDGNSEFRESRI